MTQSDSNFEKLQLFCDKHFGRLWEQATGIIWLAGIFVHTNITWCNVIVEKRRALFHEDSQVVLDYVFSFDAILDKDGSAHDVIDDVVFDKKAVGSWEASGKLCKSCNWETANKLSENKLPFVCAICTQKEKFAWMLLLKPLLKSGV